MNPVSGSSQLYSEDYANDEENKENSCICQSKIWILVISNFRTIWIRHPFLTFDNSSRIGIQLFSFLLCLLISGINISFPQLFLLNKTRISTIFPSSCECSLLWLCHLFPSYVLFGIEINLQNAFLASLAYNKNIFNND